MFDKKDSEQNKKKLFARTMKDAALRREMLNNPRAVLERELGIKLPAGTNVQVHVNSPDTLHIVLPSESDAATAQELSDADLEAVSGGLPCSGHGSNSVTTWGGGLCTPCM
ncbi:hypothetical protein KDH_08610 [Dictyobacter sp. S3.2.2.5]|uniref:Nitrile hydratase alpha /Thiocyanate hydrolase gamma domain-containing protein n=1 Tax=Dictyobacter halimunensis TaxID=3026934 RepID=A0ABQ6FLX4_9CHLR|nr:hypothetical protein KDH_08610 [Dictyobacter sp. S3.2.2.5]